MLDKGSITTDELNEMGYNHPPRAAGDVRDAGIPVDRVNILSEKTGRQMAMYTFGDPDKIQDGRSGGRTTLPKKLKAALIARYGSIDCITGAKLDERALQMDHRIPYRIAADEGLGTHDVEAFMLLDASSQRAKSWSCEHCPNMELRDVEICKTCFWAFPENYTHIAMEDYRRTDISWQGGDVAVHDRIKQIAESRGTSVRDFMLEMARQRVKDS